MKNYFPAMAAIALFFACSSCKQFNSLSDLLPGTKVQAQGAASLPGIDEMKYSQPIPVDTSNKMIMSYLRSIEYETNKKAIRSWAFNADTLRRYLNEGKGKNIMTMKFMLAHTLTYINSGHYGERPSPLDNNHALTIVLVGVDSTGNYVLNEEDMDYDQCMPCPENCIGSPTIAK